LRTTWTAKSWSSHSVISIFSSEMSATGFTGCPVSARISSQAGSSGFHSDLTRPLSGALALGLWYDFHEYEWHLGNVGWRK
jgi:hypothetical protein